MFRTTLLGAAIAAGSIGAASAADLYGRGGSIKDGYMPVAAQGGPSSWYFRADVGHARYDDPSIVQGSRFDLAGSNVDNQWSAGLGIGRYFGNNVRGDITWDYRFESDVKGSVPVGATFTGERTFGLRSNVVLANIYYDFDLRSRFTPYIGLGIGFAYNETTGGTIPDGCGACAFSDVTIAGGSKWSAAGALMTGFSLAMRDRLHLDAGYRYLYLGDVKTGTISGTLVGPPAATATDGELHARDLFAHEFRVGLRYDLR
jgi:opacity protein-like surface antigen